MIAIIGNANRVRIMREGGRNGMGRLIDADRLKAHYCWWAGGGREMTLDEAKKTFDTIIDVQPTVDAIPKELHVNLAKMLQKLQEEYIKHGHWSFSHDPRMSDFECSECLEHNDICTKYCPNCGARMDEVEDAKIN